MPILTDVSSASSGIWPCLRGYGVAQLTFGQRPPLDLFLELRGPSLNILDIDAFAVEDLALLLLGVAVVATLLRMMFRKPGMEKQQLPTASPCSTPRLKPVVRLWGLHLLFWSSVNQDLQALAAMFLWWSHVNLGLLFSTSLRFFCATFEGSFRIGRN